MGWAFKPAQCPGGILWWSCINALDHQFAREVSFIWFSPRAQSSKAIPWNTAMKLVMIKICLLDAVPRSYFHLLIGNMGPTTTPPLNHHRPNSSFLLFGTEDGSHASALAVFYRIRTWDLTLSPLQPPGDLAVCGNPHIAFHCVRQLLQTYITSMTSSTIRSDTQFHRWKSFAWFWNWYKQASFHYFAACTCMLHVSFPSNITLHKVATFSFLVYVSCVLMVLLLRPRSMVNESRLTVEPLFSQPFMLVIDTTRAH